MKYRVSMTSRAEWQLASAALWWSESRSRQQAAEWLEGFQAALRCWLTTQNDGLHQPSTTSFRLKHAS